MPEDLRWCEAHPPDTHPVPRDGRRHCGTLERILRRQWDPEAGPPPVDLITAVDRLAALPGPISFRIANWADSIWIGAGNVPDLDRLDFLRGQPVRPPEPELWDNVPGALIGRTIAIGTGGHVSVSLADHEIGHAMAAMDNMVTDSEWPTIMRRCQSAITLPRYRDPHEFWAEAWAHFVTGQWRRLGRMLSNDTTATDIVLAYYRRHYRLEVTGR